MQAYSRRPFPVPVLVTGEITENTLVHRVDQIPAKVQAAWKELDGGEGLILVPKIAEPLDLPPNNHCGRLVHVTNLQEDIHAIWGEDLYVHQEFRDLEYVLEDIRKNTHYQENISRIQELLKIEHPPMDRLFLQCDGAVSTFGGYPASKYCPEGT